MDFNTLKREWNGINFSGSKRELDLEDILTSDNRSNLIEFKMANKNQMFVVPCILALFVFKDINKPDFIAKLISAAGFIALYLPFQIAKHRNIKKINIVKFRLSDVVTSLGNLQKILRTEIIIGSVAIVSCAVWVLFHFFINRWENSDAFAVDFALFIFAASAIIITMAIFFIFVEGTDIRRIGKIMDNIGSIE